MTQTLGMQKPLCDASVTACEAAMAFIRANFAKGIRLPDVARAAGRSPFHLHRIFKQHFGRNVKTVITELQVDLAKKKLLAGETKFNVAMDCGFSHQSHFCERFKKVTGMTASRWLRNERNNPSPLLENE